MSMRVRICTINGERCVYQGERLIANIYDHRRTDRRLTPTVQGAWGVAWANGRYDWHNSYQEARDNALKGA